MRHTDLFQSTAFRLAFAFAGFFFLASLLVVTIVYVLVTSELEDRVKRNVNVTTQSFASIFTSDGRAALVTTTRRHADVIEDGESIFLLLDRAGASLAGNIEPIAPFDDWKVLPYEALAFVREPTDDADYYYLKATKIGDMILIVGQSNDDIDDAQEILLTGLGWGLAATVVLGLAAGYWLGAQARQRIRTIERVLAAVAEGDFEPRIALSGRGDDLDRISGRINTAVDRLQDLIDSMRQISADIAHDLKTPIGRLRQKLETARKSAHDVQAYETAVDAAIEEADDIAATFEALLRIAQLEAGTGKDRFRPIDLRLVCEAIVEAYELVAEDAGHSLALDMPNGASAMISGDEELLNQMFANLVENAIKHCPDPDTVTLKLSSSAEHVSAQVCDDGPGIPDDANDKVLRRLFRLERSRTTPGNGLGLAMVAAIAKLHDADLRLDNNNPGLMVTINFPVSATPI